MFIKLPWWLKLDWRHTQPVLAMCALEFPFTVACLALYGIADPDTYRTALWTEGSDHGWNSDPIEILYSYANHNPISPPAPWNQFVTDFNVVISVLSMFILLVKTVCYIMHILPPIFSAVLHAGLAAIYAVSLSQQLGSDYSDLNHPSQFPWMFTHGCGPPVATTLTGFCRQAQASVAVAALQCALFTSFMIYSIVMAIPTKAQKEEAIQEAEEEANHTDYYAEKQWEYEMARLPQTPGSPLFHNDPMTPRTLAFNTLDGTLSQAKSTVPAASPTNKDLPLRHHISMGRETFKSTEAGS